MVRMVITKKRALIITVSLVIVIGVAVFIVWRTGLLSHIAGQKSGQTTESQATPQQTSSEAPADIPEAVTLKQQATDYMQKQEFQKARNTYAQAREVYEKANDQSHLGELEVLNDILDQQEEAFKKIPEPPLVSN